MVGVGRGAREGREVVCRKEKRKKATFTLKYREKRKKKSSCPVLLEISDVRWKWQCISFPPAFNLENLNYFKILALPPKF